TGWFGLPSILIARPSRDLTRMPQPAEHSMQVLAYQVGTPGIWSFGATRYGMSLSAGGFAPPEAAPAPPMPTSMRNSRRVPGHRLAALPVLGQLLDLGALGDRHLVAAHARAQRGDVRDRRLVGGGVAVEAIHAQLAGVDVVREVNRLLRTLAAPQLIPERLR